MRTRALHVAFVNNMPDGAFADTEAQFEALLGIGAPGVPDVEVLRYASEERRAAAGVDPAVRARYAPVAEMFPTRPDGVVVTGCEPGAGGVRDEPLWPLLTRILDWAPQATGSLWLACLAAHAALAHYEGLERRPLPAKLSGVLRQSVAAGHPLTRGLPGEVAIPHSRLNEVPAGALVVAGYRLALASERTGWTVATAERGDCLVVAVQGHPEYRPDTLLREYRRDVRRWLAGEREVYPALPEGYLDAEGERRLAAFRRRAESGRRTPELAGELPFAAEAARLRAPWTPVAARLGRNWLGALDLRRGAAARPAAAGEPGPEAKRTGRVRAAAPAKLPAGG